MTPNPTVRSLRVPKVLGAVPVYAARHHVVLLDCSGSMARDLGKIRTQLKDKLLELVGEDDRVTIIWFSGRGQAGYVLQTAQVARLSDYAALTKALDRELVPRGLTGFVDPLALALGSIHAAEAECPGLAANLFFMSDGCDNEWTKKQILAATDALMPHLGAATVVEYGYYADRPMLARMAESLGGSVIFSESFLSYQPAFERAMKMQVATTRVQVDLPEVPADGLVFALLSGDILTFDGSGGSVSVPEGVDRVYWVGQDGASVSAPSPAAVYAAISLYARRMQPEVVYPLLRITGDVRLIKLFANCFGKQAYSDFTEEAMLAAFDDRLRLNDGFDPNLVPDENAYTLLDLLSELAAHPENRFLPDHPAFKYNPIGRLNVQLEGLSDNEKDKLEAEFKVALESGDPAQRQAVQDRMNAAFARIDAGARFIADKTDGYPISALVPNATRPNISALVCKPGSVCFKNVPEGMPRSVHSQIWRNYTLIKDGLVNVDVLPVRLTYDAYEILRNNGVPLLSRPDAALTGVAPEVLKPDDYGYSPYFTYELDLKALPVINRAMVKKVSAASLVLAEYTALQLKADAKVYDHFLTQLDPQKPASKLADQYGADAALWLAQQGVTERGFAPKTEKAPATDRYQTRELKVSLKGFSSLPKVEDVLKRLDDEKPLTAAQQLLVSAIAHVEHVQSEYEGKPDQALAVLKQHAAKSREAARALAFDIAKLKFAVIVGQTWFSDLATLDDTAVNIDVDGTPVSATVEMFSKDVEI